MPTTDERVRRVIADHLGRTPEPGEPGEKQTLESLGADSLDRIELVMALEEEFSIEIPDEVAPATDSTVGHAIRTVTTILANEQLENARGG